MIMYDGNDIIIADQFFKPKDILECGQVFRYKKTEDGYVVFAGDKMCEIVKENLSDFNNIKDCKSDKDILCVQSQGTDDCDICDKAQIANSKISCHNMCECDKTEDFCGGESAWRIKCSDKNFWYKYFDLGRDYSAIVAKLQKMPFMLEATKYGKGIRILAQDPFEVLISFIVSANNNIPRIKKIVEGICSGFGKNMGGYYAFPSPSELAQADSDFFVKIGAGYRANYLATTAKAVAQCDNLQLIFAMNTAQAGVQLRKFLGVGEKVADCIMLFAYGKTDLFPVDTWVRKIYAQQFCDAEKSAKVMRVKLMQTYGELAGFAQQYLFYYKRFIDGIK